MPSIEISDFEEKEYNLSELGLEGFFFCEEEFIKYIYGPNFYLEIDDNTIFEKKDDNFILKDEDNSIILPSEQFEILKSLF